MSLSVGERAASEVEWIEWLGSSEMARRVAAFDWSRTPLGPIADWPQGLRSAVVICLRTPFQMAIYWGPSLTCIYNDAERDAVGHLHPGALGLPAREVLRDAWDVLGPRLTGVVDRGQSISAEGQPLTFHRQGRLENSSLSYSYSPLLDDDGTVGGVLRLRPSRAGTDAAAAQGQFQERVRHEGELRALLNDLRAAQRRVAAAGDAERRRIERDLHDGAQQRLMALRLELTLLAERLQADPAAALERLRELRRELDEALEELRELAHGLYPSLLASDGLAAALTASAGRSPIPVTVDAVGVTRAPRSIESTAYFCCLEAVQNAVKHAGAEASAVIKLRMRDGRLEFAVHDDGAGFDAASVRPGHGLINLRDRLEALGGHVSVTSAPGTGTTVAGHLPLP